MKGARNLRKGINRLIWVRVPPQLPHHNRSRGSPLLNCHLELCARNIICKSDLLVWYIFVLGFVISKIQRIEKNPNICRWSVWFVNYREHKCHWERSLSYYPLNKKANNGHWTHDVHYVTNPFRKVDRSDSDAGHFNHPLCVEALKLCKIII